MAERAPETCRLDEELQPHVAFEPVVVGRCLVAGDRVGDGAVDMECGGAGRPVARAFLATDRPPGERSAAEAELAGSVTGEIEGGVAPAKRVRDGLRRR